MWYGSFGASRRLFLGSLALPSWLSQAKMHRHHRDCVVAEKLEVGGVASMVRVLFPNTCFELWRFVVLFFVRPKRFFGLSTKTKKFSFSSSKCLFCESNDGSVSVTDDAIRHMQYAVTSCEAPLFLRKHPRCSGIPEKPQTRRHQTRFQGCFCDDVTIDARHVT